MCAMKVLPESQDLTDEEFDWLTVLQRIESNAFHKARYLCRCRCGNLVIRNAAYLRRKGKYPLSCGCSRPQTESGKVKDLTGQRFGRLVALYQSDIADGSKAIWRCQCDCGNTCDVRSAPLVRGDTRSCGCLRKELARARIEGYNKVRHTPDESLTP